MVRTSSLGFKPSSKKNVSITWAGKTICIGTFLHGEAEEKLAQAKTLANQWRTKEPRPTTEWAKRELELAGIRVVSNRGWKKRKEKSYRGSVVNGSDDESDESDEEDETIAMVCTTMGSNQSKKRASVTWGGKTIFLGMFPPDEAKQKSATARALTKKWGTTMSPKPTMEWVKRELELLRVRVLGRKKRSEDNGEDIDGSDDDEKFSGGSDGEDSEGECLNNNSGVARGSQANYNSGSKHKKSPNGKGRVGYALKEDTNDTHLSMKDSRYAGVVEKYAVKLAIATASDKQIRKEKIRPEANKALNDLKSLGGRLLKPGSWDNWSGLSNEEFEEEALEKIVGDLRSIVLKKTSNGSVG